MEQLRREKMASAERINALLGTNPNGGSRYRKVGL